MATAVGTKLIAIAGPTASGKTELALALGRKYGGEVICADSRTIYRDMDIGTAKPTSAEQREVPHHLLDVADPGEILSAAVFKTLAMSAIQEIWARGKLPLLVGGSGLYLDSVLYDYQFPPEADPARRAQLEQMTLLQLCELLASEDEEAYARVDLSNRRRVIRAIETVGYKHSRLSELRPGMMILGRTMNKKIAQERIRRRIELMLEQGFLKEVKSLGEHYGWDSTAFDIIGYRAFKEVALGTKTVEQGVLDFVRGDMALYKKQVTWFKRNPDIAWVENTLQAEVLVSEFLLAR